MKPETINLLGTLASVAVSFFLLSPAIALTIAQFTVQKKFNDIMIENGVVSPEEVKKLHPKKQIAGLILSCVILGVVVSICISGGWASAGFTAAALALGVFRQRKVLEFNSFTAQRFKAAYGNVMDAKKYNKYIDENF